MAKKIKNYRITWKNACGIYHNVIIAYSSFSAACKDSFLIAKTHNVTIVTIELIED